MGIISMGLGLGLGRIGMVVRGEAGDKAARVKMSPASLAAGMVRAGMVEGEMVGVGEGGEIVK
jgi:hypothetical protein